VFDECFVHEVAVVDRLADGRVEYFFLDLGMYLELVADPGNQRGLILS
jgi:hypothetical protein